VLYLGIQNASKKLTMQIHGWNITLSQLAIFFEGRLDGVLDLCSDDSRGITVTQNSEHSHSQREIDVHQNAANQSDATDANQLRLIDICARRRRNGYLAHSLC